MNCVALRHVFITMRGLSVELAGSTELAAAAEGPPKRMRSALPGILKLCTASSMAWAIFIILAMGLPCLVLFSVSSCPASLRCLSAEAACLAGQDIRKR